MASSDSDAEDNDANVSLAGHVSFSEDSYSALLDDSDLNGVFTSDEEESEDNDSTDDTSSDEEEGSSGSSVVSNDEESLSDISDLSDSDGLDGSVVVNISFASASGSDDATSSEDDSSDYLESENEEAVDSGVVGQVVVENVPSREISTSLVGTSALFEGRRKRRSSELENLKIGKKVCMDEKNNEREARKLQIEETKEFLKGTHLECPICLDESPKIKNPMFCVFCFKIVGCEPCCRKWVRVSKKNIVKRGSTCPLCRHNFVGSFTSNLVVVYETEVTI